MSEALTPEEESIESGLSGTPDESVLVEDEYDGPDPEEDYDGPDPENDPQGDYSDEDQGT